MSVTHQDKAPPRGRFFYGWLIVLAGFTAQMISSLSMQGLATYTTPLRQEFGWTLGQTAAGRSLQASDTLLGPLSGVLVDRFGARVLMITGTLLFLAAFVLFSQIETLLGFFLACLLMGVANSLLGLLIVAQAINAWFVSRRSAAMGLAVAGFAVAGFVLIPVVIWAQQAFGWRATAFGTGICIVAFGLPVMALVRSTPESMGLRPYGALAGAASKAAAEGMTLAEALRSRRFWLLTAAMSFAGLHQAALLVHFFSYVEAVDSRVMAGFVIALVNIFNLLGRVVGGLAGDYLPKAWFLACGAAAAGIGLLLLSATEGQIAVFAFAIIFGFSWGSRTAVFSALSGEIFGRRSFGKIAGVSQTLVAVATIASPLLFGWMIDLGTSYALLFAVLGLGTLLSALLFVLCQPAAKAATG